MISIRVLGRRSIQERVYTLDRNAITKSLPINVLTFSAGKTHTKAITTVFFTPRCSKTKNSISTTDFLRVRVKNNGKDY
jgi:hypothetical protein